jgi:hypothetical protein
LLFFLYSFFSALPSLAATSHFFNMNNSVD